jgi:hypothetical protein
MVTAELDPGVTRAATTRAARAARLRAEARELQARMRDKLLKADQLDYETLLRADLSAASQRLDLAREAEAAAAATLAEAMTAEAEAAARLTEARKVQHKAEQSEARARSSRPGPAAEAGALLRLRTAQEVTGRCERERAAAGAAREGAEAALASARKVAARHAAEHAQAAQEVREPGYVPRSRDTIAADLLFQVTGGSGKLDVVDQATAGILAEMALIASGGSRLAKLPLLAAAPAGSADAYDAEPERTPDGRIVTWSNSQPIIATGEISPQQAAEVIATSGGEVVDRSAADVRQRMMQEIWAGQPPEVLNGIRQGEVIRQQVARFTEG